MRGIVRGAAIATAFVLLASTAQAQSVNPISFGVAGGMSFPTGEDRDYVKNGYHGEVMMGIHLPTAPVWFRVEGFYHKFSAKEGYGDGSARVLGGAGNVMWDMPSAGMVKVYLTAGGGVYNIKQEAEVPVVVTDQRLRLGVQTETVEAKDTKFGVNGGLGVRFTMAGINPFVEARYHSVFTEGESTNVIPVTVGIMFR
ncbi:MAG TPA: outer membrane beta-barrel protein [Gemmatimonadaceae bacterium]|nr:outer membrane beta-barrel protein [Gemmatimonadaceae bacterium]